MRNFILIILFLVLALWGGSSLIPQVRDVVVESPPAIIDTSIVAPIPMPRLDRTSVVEYSHYAQVGSFKSRDDAFSHVKSLYSKLGSIEVRKVHLDNGTWYRTVIPADTLSHANELCAKAKSLGIDCLVLSFKS